MTEQILRKQPNEIIINDRTKSPQTTEKWLWAQTGIIF
jgi:hypothetical protein